MRQLSGRVPEVPGGSGAVGAKVNHLCQAEGPARKMSDACNHSLGKRFELSILFGFLACSQGIYRRFGNEPDLKGNTEHGL